MRGEIVVYLFGGFVMAVTSVAGAYHYRRWKLLRAAAAKKRTVQIDFEERQQRRRFQQCLLGGQAGASLTFSGYALSQSSVLGVWLVVLAILFVVWALFLALGDLASIHSHYQWMQTHQMAEQSQLEAELRAEAEKAAGQAKEDDA